MKVTLLHYGEKKIATIKALREMSKLGLQEAKSLVESGRVLLNDYVGEMTEEQVESLRQAGAEVEVEGEHSLEINAILTIENVLNRINNKKTRARVLNWALSKYVDDQ